MNFHKKNIILLVSILLITSFIFTSCGYKFFGKYRNGEESESEAESSIEPLDEEITLKFICPYKIIERQNDLDRVPSSYYVLKEHLESNIGNLKIELVGLSEEQDSLYYYEAVNNDEAQLALVPSNTLFYYYQGEEGKYAETEIDPHENLRTISPLYERPLHILLRTDPESTHQLIPYSRSNGYSNKEIIDIIKLQQTDKKGITIAAGASSSAQWQDIRFILQDVLGLSVSNEGIEIQDESGDGDEVENASSEYNILPCFESNASIRKEMFMYGQNVDIFARYYPLGDDFIQEQFDEWNTFFTENPQIGNLFNVNFISMNETIISRLIDSKPYINRSSIDPIYYPKLINQPVNTISISEILITNKSVAPEIVEKIAAALMTSKYNEELKDAISALVPIYSKEQALEHVIENPPMHTGTDMYIDPEKYAPWYMKVAEVWGEVLIGLLTMVVAVLSYAFARYKKKKGVKLVRSVDRIFFDNKSDPVRCKEMLEQLRDNYFQKYSMGKMDDTQYKIIETQIKMYLDRLKDEK